MNNNQPTVNFLDRVAVRSHSSEVLVVDHELRVYCSSLNSAGVPIKFFTVTVQENHGDIVVTSVEGWHANTKENPEGEWFQVDRYDFDHFSNALDFLDLDVATIVERFFEVNERFWEPFLGRAAV